MYCTRGAARADDVARKRQAGAGPNEERSVAVRSVRDATGAPVTAGLAHRSVTDRHGWFRPQRSSPSACTTCAAPRRLPPELRRSSHRPTLLRQWHAIVTERAGARATSRRAVRNQVQCGHIADCPGGPASPRLYALLDSRRASRPSSEFKRGCDSTSTPTHVCAHERVSVGGQLAYPRSLAVLRGPFPAGSLPLAACWRMVAGAIRTAVSQEYTIVSHRSTTLH
jgi:hypothetical protein